VIKRNQSPDQGHPQERKEIKAQGLMVKVEETKVQAEDEGLDQSLVEGLPHPDVEDQGHPGGGGHDQKEDALGVLLHLAVTRRIESERRVRKDPKRKLEKARKMTERNLASQ